MAGLIIFDNLMDKTNGFFFRRVYGSIGCIDDSSMIVNYEMLYDNKYISVINFQDASIAIGETKEIKINTVIKINDSDIVYFLPILEIKINGKTYCFMPFNQISNYKGMTYQDVKAYIK